MKRSLLWKFLQMICRVGTTLLFDLKVYGKHNVPREGPALLLANHQSLLDMIVVAVQLDRPVSFMARSDLFDNRLLAWLITTLHAFPIRQGEADVTAIRESIRRLKEGHVLNIYPEGSRTLTGEIGPIEPGAALIAKRSGVPIVPIAIHGAFEAWPRGRNFFRPHRIYVLFGPPMEVRGLSTDQLVELLDQTLRTLLAALRRKAAAETAAERVKRSSRFAEASQIPT